MQTVSPCFSLAPSDTVSKATSTLRRKEVLATIRSNPYSYSQEATRTEHSVGQHRQTMQPGGGATGPELYYTIL